jgi:3-oxoacyl-(acyl-carrier-protein) synthase
MVHKGPKGVHPLLIPVFAPNMASCQVSMAFGIHGPSSTSAAACASGVQAFVDAVHMIQRGEADVVVTGGTEAGLTPVAIASLTSMTALSRRNDPPEAASRPFDLGRDGFVFSEGSAIAILESEEHALKRGAPIIAEVLGGAYTSDAYHITGPAPGGRGAALAMKRALTWSDVDPTEIDFVAAHATATDVGDVAETEALKAAFGDHAYKLAISANKSSIGHLLGAAGAVSSLSAILAIRDQVSPPTLNLTDPDPRCDLNYTPLVSREVEVNASMSSGFGFGGQNAVCLFRKYEGYNTVPTQTIRTTRGFDPRVVDVSGFLFQFQPGRSAANERQELSGGHNARSIQQRPDHQEILVAGDQIVNVKHQSIGNEIIVLLIP